MGKKGVGRSGNKKAAATKVTAARHTMTMRILQRGCHVGNGWFTANLVAELVGQLEWEMTGKITTCDWAAVERERERWRAVGTLTSRSSSAAGSGRCAASASGRPRASAGRWIDGAEGKRMSQKIVREKPRVVIDLRGTRIELRSAADDAPPTLIDQICAALGPNEAPVVDALGRCVGVASRFGGTWRES